MSLALRYSDKETSREADSQEELSPLEDFTDDEDMEALISQVRRKKPRLKHPRDELSVEFSNEGTERTPLLKGKTSLRPKQRSLSKSLSPTAVETNVEPERTVSKDFYTPKRQSLSHVSHSRSGEISVSKNYRQHKASASASASKAPLQDHLPFSPSTARKNDLLSAAHINKETYLGDDSSESSSEEEHAGEGIASKPVDPKEKSGLSQALKDMTSVLNKLVKRVESNSSEIHALKNTLQNGNTPSSSSESSCGSKKPKIPAIVRVCIVIYNFVYTLQTICYLLPEVLYSGNYRQCPHH